MVKFDFNWKGFSTFDSPNGLTIRKKAAPILESIFLMPFLLGGIFLTLATGWVGYLTFFFNPVDGAEESNFVLYVFSAMMFLGAIFCGWFVRAILKILLPSKLQLEETDKEIICTKTTLGIAFSKCRYIKPVRVLLDVYDGSRGDWTFSASLTDGDHKTRLIIPTSGGSRNRIQKAARTFGAALASRLDVEIAERFSGKK